MKQKFFTAAVTLVLAFALTTYSTKSDALPGYSIYAASQCQPMYGKGESDNTLQISPSKIMNISPSPQWVTCPIDNEGWQPKKAYRHAWIFHNGQVGDVLRCYSINVYGYGVDITDMQLQVDAISGVGSHSILMADFPNWDKKAHPIMMHQGIQCELPPGHTMYFYNVFGS